MPLRSRLFKNDPALEACAVSDPAHVKLGAVGDHVAKIQAVLEDADGLQIDPGEREAKRYGPSTAAAVLAYKKKRSIINRAYQSQPDDIVGKMTVAAMDEELFKKEVRPVSRPRNQCSRQ
jgi:peptidoglycan hydrolase-like protein with peptidoglycan-binding domain